MRTSDGLQRFHFPPLVIFEPDFWADSETRGGRRKVRSPDPKQIEVRHSRGGVALLLQEISTFFYGSPDWFKRRGAFVLKPPGVHTANTTNTSGLIFHCCVSCCCEDVMFREIRAGESINTCSASKHLQFKWFYSFMCELIYSGKLNTQKQEC